MLSEIFALIALGGSLSDEISAAKTASGATLILCADSGAEHAQTLGLTIDTIVGDLDSISPGTIHHFQGQKNRPCEIIKIPDQERNDFEKVLAYLSERWNGAVRILGMTGGRADHTISNFSVMLRYADTFSNIEAFDGKFIHSLLTTKKNHRSIECPIGTTISLMPYG